ncbi:hypothetical protein ONR57_01925 [Hoyosella sp. YIM 151337]|nr:hypothetical protein [Hoyosella sp. YIM 151337]MCW4352054.1 hypothetical protein [Hoyosella sp. YIM 151337]
MDIILDLINMALPEISLGSIIDFLTADTFPFSSGWTFSQGWFNLPS